MSEPAILVQDVSKVYGSGDAAVLALSHLDLRVELGEYVAIMGSSGSGKSTLMNIIGCLDVASTGSYELNGHDVSHLDEDTLALVRSKMIGFVFQSFHLIPRMSALANIELPLTYGGVSRAERRARASHLLDLVGLTGRADHHPNALSGGQQQRVAIARALAMSPAILLADEPTGNLDSTSSGEVMELLGELNDAGRTVILITHEEEVAAHAGRVIRMLDGRVVEDTSTPAAARS